MTAQIVRTDEEITEVLNHCDIAEAEGKSAYTGMTYEDGLKAMYGWLTEKHADPVIEAADLFTD